MANPEHLELIQSGVLVWNVYVSQQPAEFRADLREANLAGADLSRADLREANLNGANLTLAHLREANLREAHLNGAHLSRADLREADLNRAYLNRAHLNGAHLREANLAGADLSRADLREANLNGANLTLAHLREANLNGADLREANLNGADLREANLRRAIYDSSTVWPEGFDPDAAGARTTGNELELDELSDPSSPDESPQTLTSTEAAVGQGWGQVVRIDSFESQERLQIASRSIEVILGYFRQVLDDETLDMPDLGVLQSEYDVLTGLARNPKGLDPQRVEQAIAEAMKVLGPHLSEEPTTNNFLNAVQRLGTPDPGEDGEVLIEVVEAAADIAAIEADEPAQTTETGEEKERSFGRRVLDGMDDNAEELGKKILLDVLPHGAKKGVIYGATAATFVATGKAAPALKAIVEFVISIIG